MGIFAKYRQAMQHEFGWEVELTCPACSHTGLPKYDGWKPSAAIGLGRTATVHAQLSCPQCGHDLQPTAKEKLVELFSPVKTSKAAWRIILWGLLILLGLMAVPLVLQLVFGQHPWLQMLWWLPIVFLGPMILLFNYRIALLRQQCPCGSPHYIFMGMLGRSYCYRCSTCGRLLRLRD